jgi:hypothetical protein
VPQTDEFCVLDFSGAAAFGFLDYIEGFEGDLRSSEPQEPSAARPTAKLKSGPKKLADNMGNHDGVLIVSPRLMTFLAEHVTDVEFIPIDIVGAKKKVLSGDYHVAHLLNHVDCIDMKNAQPHWSWDKKTIERMNDRKLPLLPDAIPTTRNLFYAKLFTALPLLRRSFGEKLLAGRFTNVGLRPIEEALAYL